MQIPPTSLAMPSVVMNLAEEVSFVHKLDDKYICLVCHNALRPPVLQTSCGHRLCSACVPDLFKDCNEIMCAGGEEECEVLRPNEVMGVSVLSSYACLYICVSLFLFLLDYFCYMAGNTCTTSDFFV